MVISTSLAKGSMMTSTGLVKGSMMRCQKVLDDASV